MEEILSYFNRPIPNADILDLVVTFVKDNVEISTVILAAIFILILSIWVIFERLDEAGWKSLIPIYRFVVLFRALGSKPWFALLMLIPGINLIMLIILYVYLARAFKRSYIFVPGILILPIIFLPAMAFGEGECDHYQPHAKIVDAPVKKPKKSAKVVKKPIDQKTTQSIARPTSRRASVQTSRRPLVASSVHPTVQRRTAKPLSERNRTIRIKVIDLDEAERQSTPPSKPEVQAGPVRPIRRGKVIDGIKPSRKPRPKN